MRTAFAEVLRVATPLMISTGMFSVVLFVDRTLLLRHNPSEMSASMAGGNAFWSVICIFVGIASMTGAIISQYMGTGRPSRVGRLLWQAAFFSLASLPVFLACGLAGEWFFRLTGQPDALIGLETTYFRILMWGGAGEVLQTALSGFFSGTHRTRVIMLVSIASAVVNLFLDVVLIFGIPSTWLGPIAGLFDADVEGRIFHLGIAGAAIASSCSFWFKAMFYVALLTHREIDRDFGIRRGFRVDLRMLKTLIFFGLPSGLMSLTEAGGFTAIVQRIGRLGDVPLQATSMAINFNMIAFIPLVGMSIAASVLVGRHLTETGPEAAVTRVRAALIVGWLYSIAWAVAYVMIPDRLIAFYQWASLMEANSAASIAAESLLWFVAIYVLLDATQLILAGALRGAGDTWFVLAAGAGVSIVSVIVGIAMEPECDAVDQTSIREALLWWWWIITGWVIALAFAMSLRFRSRAWQHKRMV